MPLATAYSTRHQDEHLVISHAEKAARLCSGKTPDLLCLAPWRDAMPDGLGGVARLHAGPGPARGVSDVGHAVGLSECGIGVAAYIGRQEVKVGFPGLAFMLAPDRGQPGVRRGCDAKEHMQGVGHDDFGPGRLDHRLQAVDAFFEGSGVVEGGREQPHLDPVVFIDRTERTVARGQNDGIDHPRSMQTQKEIEQGVGGALRVEIVRDGRDPHRARRPHGRSACGGLKPFAVERQVWIEPGVSPVAVKTAQVGRFSRVVMEAAALALQVQQLGVGAVDVSQAALDQTEAVVDVIVGYGEIGLIKAAHLQEQRLGSQQAGGRDGGILARRADKTHIAPVVRPRVSEGMTDQAVVQTVDNAGVLDRAVFEIEARADAPNAVHRHIAHHLAEPGGVKNLGVVVQQQHQLA